MLERQGLTFVKRIVNCSYDMRTIKIQNKNEIVEFLKSLGTGSAFVSLRTETEVVMNKTGNPFIGTVKVTKRCGIINVNFVKSVRRRMANILKVDFDETVYVPGVTWYKHVHTEEGKPLSLCVHQDDAQRFYVQFFPLKTEKAEYFLNGEQLTENEVRIMYDFFVPKKKRNVFKPIVIVVAIDSIREMRARSITLMNKTVDRIAMKLSELRPAQKRVPLAK